MHSRAVLTSVQGSNRACRQTGHLHPARSSTHLSLDIVATGRLTYRSRLTFIPE